jgi:hypothetical protein
MGLADCGKSEARSVLCKIYPVPEYRQNEMVLISDLSCASEFVGWLMKSVRQQLKDVAWKSRTWSIRDFRLTVMVGFAIPFGILAWTEGDSVRNPFDLKLAISCFVLGGVCVFLASNKVYVPGCAVVVPAALIWGDAIITRNQKALLFCLEDLAFGFAILVVGTLAKSLCKTRLSRRSK